MSLPALSDRSRRHLVVLLIGLAVVQAILAALGAAALGGAITAPTSQIALTAGIAAALALLTGLALLAERSMAERLAQSLVHDTRRSLFESVIAHAQGTREERWLTPFVGDLTALRNWAARGVIRLWTSGIAALVGSIWFLWSNRDAALALAPLASGLALCLLGALRLRHIVGEQRNARGRLTRFLIRRVRAEVEGKALQGRHGRRALDSRSRALAILAECRTRWAAMIEVAMVVAAVLAAILLVITHRTASATGSAELVTGLTLVAFVGSRLTEFARALHAYVAGRVAIQRLHHLIANKQYSNNLATFGKGKDNEEA